MNSRIDRIPYGYQLDPQTLLGKFNAIGLSLLYAAGYFLPATTNAGAYFLGDQQLIPHVVAPSLLAASIIAIILLTLRYLPRQFANGRIGSLVVIGLLDAFLMIGIKCVLVIVGYDWEAKIGGFGNILVTEVWLRVGFYLLAFVAIFFLWGKLERLSRVLASMGYAFALFAVLRLVVIGEAATAAISVSRDPQTVSTANAQRRVVWLLLDETDFGRVYGSESRNYDQLTNFKRLSKVGVFATDANSPASATVYSIPALLTGTPIIGEGVRINAEGTLALDSSMGQRIQFDEETSIFGKLRARNLSASILGFYHPYCRLFAVQACTAFAWPESSDLFSGVWSNIPNHVSYLFGRPDPWLSVSENALALLPGYIGRTQDALTFIHLNIPHLPATYADKILQLPQSPDPLTEYARNLLIADRILGDIIAKLSKVSTSQDALLIVSTDHWLRNRWYRASKSEVSRPVIFLVWHVGDTQGVVVPQAFSTVNTSAMVLAFLRGELGTQPQIGRWMQGQAVSPSFIAP